MGGIAREQITLESFGVREMEAKQTFMGVVEYQGPPTYTVEPVREAFVREAIVHQPVITETFVQQPVITERFVQQPVMTTPVVSSQLYASQSVPYSSGFGVGATTYTSGNYAG